MTESSHAITELLHRWRKGDRDALDRLVSLVYKEIKQIASKQIARNGDMTLQPTAVVHEVYMRLLGQDQQPWENRAHFFGFVARVTRSVLVDYARNIQARKRGDGVKITLIPELDGDVSQMKKVDFMILDQALSELAKTEEQKSRFVELRFFGGLTMNETAEVLGISKSTAKRTWRYAKAWLYQYMNRDATRAGC